MTNDQDREQAGGGNGQRFTPVGRLGVFLFIAFPLAGWLLSGPRTPDLVPVLMGAVWLASIPMMLIGRQSSGAAAPGNQKFVPRPTRLPSPEERRREREKMQK